MVYHQKNIKIYNQIRTVFLSKNVLIFCALVLYTRYVKKGSVSVKYYLAIDIGASSGRHILGCVDGGRLTTEEIYRFENNLIKTNDGLVWDIENLINEVKNGIKKCKEIGKIPVSVAIDTWGVDYVLSDANGNILEPVYSYRNSRTNTIDAEVESIISPEKLYSLTGIQKQKFNTIYQLYCDKKSGKLNKASSFMMMPADLSYCLTGEVCNEYTNATTTGFVNANTREFDDEIISKLEFNKTVFDKLKLPGDYIGDFTDDVQKEIGFNTKVVFCPSHDTASAVAACPLNDGDIYISSGTWSLIGCEVLNPVLTKEAKEYNFANEGGINYRFRFLKNYMGMWLFQNIRKNLNKSLTYDEMMNLAINADNYYYINVNAPEFVAPENMIEAIKKHLDMPDLSLGEILNSVYHSLAKSYNDAICEVEKISGTKSNAIRIVGGGSKDSYLNYLTAKYTGKKVTAGPVEATALGNLASQILAENKDLSLADVRNIIKNSFNITEVQNEQI